MPDYRSEIHPKSPLENPLLPEFMIPDSEFSQADNILIVNADLDEVNRLSESLVQQGYGVRTVWNWLEAQRELKDHIPHLILINYSENQEEIALIIDELERFENLACLFIIESEAIPNLTRFKLKETFDLIKIPFSREEFLLRVNHLLSGLKNKVYLNNSIQQLEQEVQKRYQTELKLEKLVKTLEKTTNQLNHFSRIDSLTHLANRCYFDEYLLREWQRLARERMSLSLIICDLDAFKSYNEIYGYQAGDSCLKTIAQTITCAVKRPADFVARYSGEEFGVILPHTGQAGALEVAKLIRAKIKALEIPHAKSIISPYLTVSLGVATRIPVPDLPPDPIITFAEEALDEAKRQGCDRIGTRVHWR